MIDRGGVREAVFTAIDEFNFQMPPDRRIERSLDTVLFGPSVQLASLDLVSLIIKTEQAVADAFGMPITLASEKALSEESSPFQTVGSLVDFIARLLEESDGE